MVCYHPLQADFTVRSDGKKKLVFSNSKAKLFEQGLLPIVSNNSLSLPCGKCMGCRLERSRQWAIRIMHEASLYADNCFVTLTYDEEHLSKMCPNGSLVRKHVQDFLKRLRRRFDNSRIRYYYCVVYRDLIIMLFCLIVFFLTEKNIPPEIRDQLFILLKLLLSSGLLVSLA